MAEGAVEGEVKVITVVSAGAGVEAEATGEASEGAIEAAIVEGETGVDFEEEIEGVDGVAEKLEGECLPHHPLQSSLCMLINYHLRPHRRQNL